MFRVTGFCARNSPVAGEFPTQRATNVENVSIWWRHHVIYMFWYVLDVCFSGNSTHILLLSHRNQSQMLAETESK